jgi:UDP-N-acetylmuramate dehydrogenase
LEELSEIIRRCAQEGMSVRLIGGGSNVLISDEGVPGMVIHLSAPRFSQIQVLDGGLIVGGGANLSHFVSTAVREGFSGPEQLVGIPGSVGGALHENTGTANADIGTWVDGVTVLTLAGEHGRTRGVALRLSPKHLNELAILEARFKFETDDPPGSRALAETLIARAQQPLSQKRAYVSRITAERRRAIDRLGGLKSRVRQVESRREFEFHRRIGAAMT